MRPQDGHPCTGRIDGTSQARGEDHGNDDIQARNDH